MSTLLALALLFGCASSSSKYSEKPALDNKPKHHTHSGYHSEGRLTQSGRQRRMDITSIHGDTASIQRAYKQIQHFFSWLKATATQLTKAHCWQLIGEKSMAIFMTQDPPNCLPQT
jgi:hypothetical protein